MWVTRTCISRLLMILKCKEFSDWSAQNVNNSGVAYWFVISDLSMQLA